MPELHPWPCPALANVSLAPRTTMKVGGAVEWLLEPSRPDQFVEAWCAAKAAGVPVRVLGGGANLLIPDGLLPGVVITTERLSRLFRPNRVEGAEWMDADADPARLNGGSASGDSEAPELVAWAGMPMPGLVRAARELSWTGLEGLVGVPGHVGGGVAMNAGGRWGNFWDVIERVRVLAPDGTVEERARAACDPKYRDGNLGGGIVLGAHLVLKRGNRLVIKETMRQYLTEKSAAQPVTERSSGCIFKNPDPEASEGRSAGQLVDQCGGKGLRRGDAIVSPKHGNFIVNEGGARAEDVRALIGAVRRLVEDKTGIRLGIEVKTWELDEHAPVFDP